MIKILTIFVLIAAFAVTSLAQIKPRPTPRKPLATVPSDESKKPDDEKGSVVGRTYTNTAYRFEVEFPMSWLIPGDDFEQTMKAQGFDLSLKAPATLTPMGQAKVNDALKRVKILLTAYRSMPGSDGNSIVRISTEDLRPNPQIKDAVDYIDAIRATYRSMKLPPDFQYSETDAEQLGAAQFAFLDTTSIEGKKRMYAMIRNGHAICFVISYTSDEDLFTLRRILEEGNFDLKR
ncbi:MAG: hypothetical protein KBF52_15020 [Pyrinomonadaceae bacterium]|nr:hypothetical protein [Pyrinomonadaceae bacterium]